MRVAIVTYNWPPRNAIGTHRPYAWAKHFAERGDSVVVITAKKYEFDEPLDLPVETLEGVRVIEVPYLRIGSVLSTFLSYLKRSSVLRYVRGFIRSHTERGVDVRSAWARAAESRALEVSRSVDVVVSTYGPDASHVIASSMKSASPNIVWVADYRDLWSSNHSLFDGKVGNQNLLERERLIVSKADLLTTVSQELRVTLESLHSSRCEVIENGYELDDGDLVANINVGRERGFRRPLRIVYTGTVYAGRQDPTLLFQEIIALEEQGLVAPGDITVDFYGGRNHELEKGISARIGSFVRFFGHVSRADALSAQQNADLLLLLEKPGENSRGVVTGKIFEYITSGTPILSLGSDAESAIARVLTRTGCGICAGTDADAVRGVLRSLVDHEPPAWWAPQLSVIREYSRSSQAARLRKLISELLDVRLSRAELTTRINLPGHR